MAANLDAIAVLEKRLRELAADSRARSAGLAPTLDALRLAFVELEQRQANIIDAVLTIDRLAPLSDELVDRLKGYVRGA